MKLKRVFMGFVISLVILTAGGLAVWLSGYQLNITGQVTGGTSPGLIMDSWDESFSPGNYTYIHVFDNTNGIVDMTFTCSDNTISNDGNCNWEAGEDLEIYISTLGFPQNGANCDEPGGHQILPGDNNITVRLVVHENACPSDSLNVTVTGTI